MSITDAGPRLANLFARKGEAAPAAAHPLSAATPDAAASSANTHAHTAINWRDVIANSRMLDLPAQTDGNVDRESVGRVPTARTSERQDQTPAPHRDKQCVTPLPYPRNRRSKEPPLAYKAVVRVTARQRRLLRIAAAALDVPQQALLRDALDSFLERLRRTRLSDCRCFAEQHAACSTSEPTSAR